MSSLNDQLNSFKSKVRHAPTIQRRVVTSASTETSSATPASKRKSTNDGGDEQQSILKKKKSTVVYSQPRNTGSGIHHSTQLVHAVEYIKKYDHPVKLQAVGDYLSVAISGLVPLLRNIDRIKVNDHDQTVEYVSIYNIYSGEDLLSYLQSQTTFQGLPVNKLKDGWNGCIAAVEKLEKDQSIVVWRTKKENAPRYVWANTGGAIGGIDEAFTTLWSRAKVPPTSELPGELEKLGLKPTSIDPATIKKATRPAEQRKQKKPRRGKITNTHMRGVLKDYGV